jgi:hypothetical protein
MRACKQNPVCVEPPAPPPTPEFMAYHEAGHAVLYEVLATGVRFATIVPTVKGEGANFNSFGRVHFNGAPLIPKRQWTLIYVACCLAGGHACAWAGYEDWTDATGGDQRSIDKAMVALGYKPDSAEYDQVYDEATNLCVKLLYENPEVWSAVEDVKDLLLAKKTISGAAVRAVVRRRRAKQAVPQNLFGGAA